MKTTKTVVLTDLTSSVFEGITPESIEKCVEVAKEKAKANLMFCEDKSREVNTDSLTIDLSNVCGIISDVWIEGTSIMGEFEFIDNGIVDYTFYNSFDITLFNFSIKALYYGEELNTIIAWRVDFKSKN